MNRLRRYLIVVLLVTGALVGSTGWSTSVSAGDGRLRLLGEYSFESGRQFQSTTIGGLSGITYDRARNVYYAISDDRGELQPARFYTLEIDLGLGGIGDVRVVGVTTLDSDAATPGIQPYARNDIDAEEIILTPSRELIVSSERDLQGRPWIRRFALDGSLLGELAVPDRFITVTETGPDGRPTVVRGVRTNLGFEGMALADDASALFVANEEALAQDGPIATLEEGTTVRILRYDIRAGWQPGQEVVYRTEKIAETPVPPTAFADNGVSAMLHVGHLDPDFDLFVMERNFSTGVGNDVRIFGVSLDGARRTETLPALAAPFGSGAVAKTELVRMDDLGVKADNLEGMTLGPRLPNGSPSLIVISDDNFSSFDPPQLNQFLLFELGDTVAQTPITPATPRPAATATPRATSAPAQVPSALPRTGTNSPGLPLLGIGSALVLVGLGLRRLARRPQLECDASG